MAARATSKRSFPISCGSAPKGKPNHDYSPHDSRNNILGLFDEEGYKDKMLFHETDGLALGTWSSSKDNPKASAGLRRYCAGKLCEVMMMHVTPNYFLYVSSLTRKIK